MWAALAMLIIGTSEVSLEVAPGVACVERARVVERLAREGVKVVPVSKGLVVDVRLSGATILVRGRVRSEVLERQVPANARDCPGVERVLAALIVSWAKRLPKVTSETVDAGVTPETVVAAPAERGDAGSAPVAPSTPVVTTSRPPLTTTPLTTSTPPLTTSTPPLTTSTTPLTTSTPPLTTSTPPLTTSTPPLTTSTPPLTTNTPDVPRPLSPSPPAGERVGERGDAGTTELPTTTTRSPSPSEPDAGATGDALVLAPVDAGSPLSPTLSPAGGEGEKETSGITLDLGALGGAAIGPTSDITGAGQAHVALGFGRFGLAVDVGLESARARTLEPATVTASTQWLSLQARVLFQPFARLRLEFLLGLRGWRLAVASTGIDEPARAELFSFGGVGTAAATIPLWGPISLQFRAVVSARWRAERFTVTNLGPVLELLPWSGTLLGGLELRFGT